MGQNDEFNFGFFIAIAWIATIIAWIYSGILAWEWVEPDSFFGAIGFIIVWGILTKVSHFFIMLLAALLTGNR